MAISLVQAAGTRTSANGGASNPASVTISAAGAQNLIVICVGIAASAAAPANFNTPTVGGSTTGVTLAASLDENGTASAQAIYYKIAAGGETTVAVSENTAASNFLGLEVMEFTGLPGWQLDKIATNDPVGSGTSCQTGSTGTLTKADGVAVAMIGLPGESGGSEAWTGGFTVEAHRVGSLNCLFAGYLITSATTALNPTGSWASANSSGGLIVTFVSDRDPVGKDLDLRWDVVQSVGKDLDLRWAVAATPVGKDLDLRWGVLAPVGKDLDLRWAVSAPVGKNLDLRWGVRGPLGTFTLVPEVAWITNPYTRPADVDFFPLSDVSDGFEAVAFKRGTKILTSGIEPGTALASLDNRRRHLDPSYSASSLAPNVVPRKRWRWPLRSDGTTTMLHTGFIETFTPKWGRDTATITIDSQDLFGLAGNIILPPSVLEVETLGIDPSSYWPMAEQVLTGQADDVVGTRDGIYLGPVAGGGQLDAYDSRPAPKFSKPGTNGGAEIDATAMVVDGLSLPDEFGFSVWFKWDVTEYDANNPTVLMLQDSSVPQTSPPGSPLSPSPATISMYVANDSIPGRHHLNIRVQDGSRICIMRQSIGHVIMDGQPHLLRFTVDGSTRTFRGGIDNITAPFFDLSQPGEDPISSINVSSVIATLNLLAVGWGIDWQSANPPANSAIVGRVGYYTRLVADSDWDTLWNAGTLAWGADRTDVRYHRILDLIGVDAADRDLDVGTQTCGPTTLGGQNGLAYIKKIVTTEAGASWVNGDGKVRFTPRPSSPPVVKTFTDDPIGDNGIPCTIPDPQFSYKRIINTVTVARENGADQVVSDAASAAKYGFCSGAITGKLETLHENADDARATGQYYVDRYKEAIAYISTIKVSSIDTAVDRAALLEIEPGDLVAVRSRPPGATAEVLSLAAQVEYVDTRLIKGKPTVIETTYSLADGVPYP